MRHLQARPTKADIALATAISRHATPLLEQSAGTLTLLADEKLLFAVSCALWLVSKRGTRQQRERADHLVLCVLASSALAHGLKHIIDQERPDRRVRPPRHGIPKSGNRLDAFPSGHAMQIGAVASAAAWIEPRVTPWIWLGGTALAFTRVVLLAHWVSDVVIGLCAGVILERLLRPVSRRLIGKCNSRVSRR